jgi:hypothetical protein
LHWLSLKIVYFSNDFFVCETPRSNKSVFPAHINLNLQALPATNMPEQLRKSRRAQTFEVDKQLANRLTLQTRPLARFSSRSRESSSTRETTIRAKAHFERGDANSERNSSNLSPAFVVSDRDIKEFGDQAQGHHTLHQAYHSHSGTPEGYSRPNSSKSRTLIERLDLDNRGLQEVPNLASEEMLKLLNLQHNHIRSLQGIQILTRLVFLDLYDNSISDMNPLRNLKSLRVLMLGKNNVEKISGLEDMTKLDVLDIHSNRLTSVEGISHSESLRVLNLAGNFITRIDKMAEMENLTELNLRRNEILSVTSLEHLHFLQRVYLSFNKIARWEDIWCLSECSALTELSLDGNPLTQDLAYRQTVLASCAKIKMLDSKRASEEERRGAVLTLKKEIERKKAEERAQIKAERRKLAIR